MHGILPGCAPSNPTLVNHLFNPGGAALFNKLYPFSLGDRGNLSAPTRRKSELEQRNPGHLLSSPLMSIGASPSDIVNIAKLCYKIYDFCRTAPAELQSLSNRLDRMGRKLDRLSDILEKSGNGTCEQTPALEQHLLDARAHLEPLLSATNGATSAKGLTRLALKQD